MFVISIEYCRNVVKNEEEIFHFSIIIIIIIGSANAMLVFDLKCVFYLFLLILLIKSSKINSYQNVPTIIGDKNITYRSSIIPSTISKLFINGPFYCQIKWIDDDNKQTMNIYTDNNIHPYIIIKIEQETLKIIIQSNVNLKFVVMGVYLNLRPIIKNIFLAGISTIYSVNMLNMNNLLKLRTEGKTKISKISL